jgi:cobalamin synthase
MTASVATRPTAVDPRAPRFGAAITAVVLLVDVFLGVAGATVAAVVLLAAVTALFAWGAFAGIRRHPYGVLFRRFVRPRLAPPAELVVTVVGLVVALAGVPLAVPIAAGLAFVAAFLNAVFDFCLGCELHLLLVRAGVLGRRR